MELLRSLLDDGVGEVDADCRGTAVRHLDFQARRARRPSDRPQPDLEATSGPTQPELVLTPARGARECKRSVPADRADTDAVDGHDVEGAPPAAYGAASIVPLTST